MRNAFGRGGEKGWRAGFAATGEPTVVFMGRMMRGGADGWDTLGYVVVMT